MTILLRFVRMLGAAWLLGASVASLAGSGPVQEELVARLASTYMQAVKPGEQAKLYRDLFVTVMQRVRQSHARDVNLPEFIGEALKTIEPLEPQSGEPSEVFTKSIDAALASLDPHSEYL